MKEAAQSYITLYYYIKRNTVSFFPLDLPFMASDKNSPTTGQKWQNPLQFVPQKELYVS
jgi:hypothetical protein